MIVQQRRGHPEVHDRVQGHRPHRADGLVRGEGDRVGGRTVCRRGPEAVREGVMHSFLAIGHRGGDRLAQAGVGRPGDFGLRQSAGVNAVHLARAADAGSPTGRTGDTRAAASTGAADRAAARTASEHEYQRRRQHRSKPHDLRA
jgi:hypothetical protein